MYIRNGNTGSFFGNTQSTNHDGGFGTSISMTDTMAIISSPVSALPLPLPTQSYTNGYIVVVL